MNLDAPQVAHPLPAEARAINDATNVAREAIQRAMQLMTAAGVAGSDADRRKLRKMVEDLDATDAREMVVTR